MKLKNTIITLLILLVSGFASQAQNFYAKENLAINPKIGAGFTSYTANFRSFEGAADCGLFESGSGFGLFAGVGFEKSFFSNSVFGLGISFADRSGELTIENTFPARDLTNNQLVDLKTETKLATTIKFVEIQPDFRWNLTDNFINGPLRLIGGLRFFIPVANTFEQTETILSPSGAVFVNTIGRRTKTREIAANDINSINGLGYGLSFGLDNLLKIGKSTHFTQELLFDYNLSDFTEDAEWSAFAVRLQLGVRFSLQEKPEPVKETPPPPPPAPVVVEKKPEPVKTAKIVSTKDIGKINSGNELLATAPLVNAVFFEKGKALPAGSYKDSEMSAEDYFKMDAVALHDNVLSRIAKIVTDNPKSLVTLESATSGNTNEPTGIELSKERADYVESRLINLGIPKSKINKQARLAPKFASNQDFPEGVAENQRVDVLLKNAPLQEYVDIQKYREFEGEIVVDIKLENFDKSASGTLSCDLNDKSYPIGGSQTVRIPIMKRLDEGATNLKYTLELKVEDKIETIEGTIDLSKKNVNVVDLSLDNFEAILRFDYNSSALSDDNKGLLRQLSEKLPAGATIQILGSADALGTEERNLILSKERAANTEAFINNVAGTKFNIETGINTEKFPEDTPQGRFLNRSIRIKVKK